MSICFVVVLIATIISFCYQCEHTYKKLIIIHNIPFNTNNNTGFFSNINANLVFMQLKPITTHFYDNIFRIKLLDVVRFTSSSFM